MQKLILLILILELTACKKNSTETPTEKNQSSIEWAQQFCINIIEKNISFEIPKNLNATNLKLTTTTALYHIKDFQNLKYLSLQNILFSKELYENLRELRDLKVLILFDCIFDPNQLSKNLVIVSNTNINSENPVILKYKSNCELTRLNAYVNDQITFDDVQFLTKKRSGIVFKDTGLKSDILGIYNCNLEN